jgi:mono/diheme cytochrome c family protein
VNSANVIQPRHFGLAASLLVLVLTGCGDYSAYPRDLKYPARTDLIVKTASTKEVWYPDPPGTLDEYIAEMSAPGEGANKVLDPKDIPEVDPKLNPKQPQMGKDRVRLRAALLNLFGTPSSPRVYLPEENEDYAITRQQIQDLKLDSAQLADGSKVYRRYCMQCHGITGDGRGPTGPWVHPHPRDYRQGVFKFISSTVEGKPRRDDLHRVLTFGVEGTSMPSFALLGEENLEALISYVTHLSLRGEVELNLCKIVLGDGSMENDTLLEEARMLTGRFVERWYNADKKPFLTPKKNTPPPSDEERLKSVERGYNYFIGKDGACIKCHADFGRQVPYRFDIWGTPVRPANLTHNLYRGGRRPIDIYWRVRGGIPPSGMPAGAGLMAGDDDTKVWDVVHFVQALPYPGMLPESVRDKVYGKKEQSEEKDRRHASVEK